MKIRELLKKIPSYLSNNEREEINIKEASNGLNMIALGFGMDYIQEGDEIITSELEHHSSILPWMEVAKRKNAPFRTLRKIP